MNRLPVSPLVLRALEVAEKHLGMAELCRRLEVPEGTIEEWRADATSMPERKWFALVDLILELEDRRK